MEEGYTDPRESMVTLLLVISGSLWGDLTQVWVDQEDLSLEA